MIVVGVDSSPGSRAALRWALREAAPDGEPVIAVHAGPPTWEVIAHTPLVEERHAAQLARLAEFAADAGAPERVDARVVDGPPADVLAREAEGARLLVVGRRGLGAVEATVLGSVSHDLVRRAACPVAVVPPDAGDTPPGRVVVGVDGSAVAEAAMRWAGLAARRHGLPLLLVHSLPGAGLFDGATTPEVPLFVEPEDGAAVVVAAEEALRRSGDAPPTVLTEVTRDPAGAALVRAVMPGDVLVVGTHGRGAAARLLLGSTSAYCVEHATTTVVVVPPPR